MHAYQYWARRWVGLLGPPSGPEEIRDSARGEVESGSDKDPISVWTMDPNPVLDNPFYAFATWTESCRKMRFVMVLLLKGSFGESDWASLDSFWVSLFDQKTMSFFVF